MLTFRPNFTFGDKILQMSAMNYENKGIHTLSPLMDGQYTNVYSYIVQSRTNHHSILPLSIQWSVC